jgi:hypothetical protein
LFDDLHDWINTSGDWNSVQSRRNISSALDGHIRTWLKAGLAVGARERFVLLTGGKDAGLVPWRVIDIKVQGATSA